MRKLATALAATVALTLGASAVFAQSTLPGVVMPPQPGSPPVPNGTDGNGGLIVSVWDISRQVSLVQYLGFNLNDVTGGPTSIDPNPLWTPASGGAINFGTLSQWTDIFGTSTAGNLRFTVMAADSLLVDPGEARIATTIGVGAVPTSITQDRVTNASNAARDFINQVNTAYTNAAVTLCEPGFSCGTLSAADGQYAGNPATWGLRYSNDFQVDAGGGVDTALRFYVMSNTSAAPTAATARQFANGSNIGTWLLSGAGNLTYSIAGGTVVPLPAAAWLLLSGLAGLGVIPRRRRSA